MMRILLLNTYPIWGGDEKWTINVGKGLLQRGHYVVISCCPGSETEKKAIEQGLEVIPFNIGPDIAFWKIHPFQKMLRLHGIEAVLCVQNRDVKIGALAARLAGIPAIFARQGLATIKHKFFHKISYTKYIDGIITNTNSIKEYYQSYSWLSNDKIHVIYDGLELPENLEKIDLHKEFDLKPNAKVIIGTGRLAEQKRFDLLIEVAAMAKVNEQNWTIIIAGTGRLEKELKRLAHEAGVDDIIKFIGFRNDVLNLMYSSDLFVLSSDSEGMSNALKEAMAVGKPCVATDVFGVSELFEDGSSGLMVNKGDSKGIYDNIVLVFSDVTLKESLQKNAASLIKKSFTMDKMITEIEQLFESQLAAKK